MNLTKRPVYQKGQKKKKKAQPATARERRYWDKICATGCIIQGCARPPGIHHCGTGAGGRKNHRKVLPLCHYHHQGDEGIDAKHNGSPQSKKTWQEKYGTEDSLMKKLFMKMSKGQTVLPSGYDPSQPA